MDIINILSQPQPALPGLTVSAFSARHFWESAEFFSVLLQKNTLLFSALSCQFISNVPSAILLSQFTENYSQLLLGVNIGGVGTLIASLASLITFRDYTKRNPGKTGSYVLLFSAFNFGFLILLTAFALVGQWLF